MEANGAQKKSIAIVGFSSKYLVELATNRNALLKIEPSINTILRSCDLSSGQENSRHKLKDKSYQIRVRTGGCQAPFSVKRDCLLILGTGGF